MKKKMAAGVLCAVMILSMMCAGVLATIMPCADEVFESTSVTLSSSGSGTFKATTKKTITKLYVSGAALQVKNGTSWSDVSTAAPSTVTKNGNSYMATKDYSGSMSSGKTYRLKAVFNADGHTITKYSGSITK